MDRADEQFIRRFAKTTAVKKDRVVLPAAFEPRVEEAALSFTFRDETLQSREALLRYRHHFEIQPSGTLPGLCFLTYANLTEGLQPPLPPRYSDDETDPVYGHLHHLTDLPSETQQNQMATQATQNGLLLPAVIKKRDYPPELIQHP
jgi:hypothetical protein